MLFASNIFLFLFLPLTIVTYYLINPKYRNVFLLIASLGFYAWGEPKFVFIMITSILFNYMMAIMISKAATKEPFFSIDIWFGKSFSRKSSLHKKVQKGKNRSINCKPRICTILLVIDVIVNLGILFIYKYLDFFITNNLLGFDFPLKEIVLPIGISFFTFQAISYVVDVYRQTVAVQKNIINVALYISFFPQLMAGPIVRYQTISDQIEGRKETFDEFGEGVRRFIIGFSKKMLIANQMALVADKAFSLPDAERSMLYAWIGAIAYSLQILFDFSGYSEMAIGLGKMFGFRFLENFDFPYMSKSVSEFWRRWHISLGQWFRDYVYFPLGGSRVKKHRRLIFNLLVVWGLTGLWHGASWNFVIWGLLYFVILAFEKTSGYPEKFSKPLAKILYRIFTLLCVILGWVIFRSPDLAAAAKYILSMFHLRGNTFFCDNVIVSIREYWLFFLAGLLCSTTIFQSIKKKIAEKESKVLQFAAQTISVFGLMFLTIWSVSYIILGAHNPFIYFNF